MADNPHFVPDKLNPPQRHLVNKRLSMNLLIQGAAAQAHQTGHHLVRDELNSINTQLLRQYDRAIAGATYSYWRGYVTFVMGDATTFWHTLHQAESPFFYHRFLRRHGRMLAEAAFASAEKRCLEKEIPTDMLSMETAIMNDILKAVDIERNHRKRLEQLAVRACSQIIGTPPDLIDASITNEPAWGTVRAPQTPAGKEILRMMVGWGGVDWIDGQLRVIGKAIVWPLLLHELVKGSMELICLHGMNELPSEDYDVVMDHTEHIEYEVPMLQVGPEFYQRFLRVNPREIALADCVMAVARMEPVELEEFFFDMIESPETAEKTLTRAVATDP